jgi:hypothetical protein
MLILVDGVTTETESGRDLDYFHWFFFLSRVIRNQLSACLSQFCSNPAAVWKEISRKEHTKLTIKPAET